jgi:hypothetical protein
MGEGAKYHPAGLDLVRIGFGFCTDGCGCKISPAGAIFHSILFLHRLDFCSPDILSSLSKRDLVVLNLSGALKKYLSI